MPPAPLRAGMTGRERKNKKPTQKGKRWVMKPRCYLITASLQRAADLLPSAPPAQLGCETGSRFASAAFVQCEGGRPQPSALSPPCCSRTALQPWERLPSCPPAPCPKPELNPAHGKSREMGAKLAARPAAQVLLGLQERPAGAALLLRPRAAARPPASDPCWEHGSAPQPSRRCHGSTARYVPFPARSCLAALATASPRVPTCPHGASEQTEQQDADQQQRNARIPLHRKIQAAAAAPAPGNGIAS